MARCCGIRVDPQSLQRWAGWLAPAAQPFFVADPVLRDRVLTVAVIDLAVTDELRDTFHLWRRPAGAEVMWLTESGFLALTTGEQTRLVREQVRLKRGGVSRASDFRDVFSEPVRASVDGRWILWWPQTVAMARHEAVCRYVELANDAGRHHQPPAAVVRRCREWLPGVAAIAGSFAQGSGPNCFGAVMAAAGIPGAEEQWMQQEAFEEWLVEHCRPRRGSSNRPGTVLVWRDADRIAQHAAVCLDEDWALEKPSQGWMTPRWIRPLPEIIRTNRAKGQRQERHQIRPGDM